MVLLVLWLSCTVVLDVCLLAESLQSVSSMLVVVNVFSAGVSMEVGGIVTVCITRLHTLCEVFVGH